MDKSVHLVTLEKLKTALSSFDMSFGVSNRLFRLAIVSEIFDTVCLFEQLLESWKRRLPIGEGPDADVDFNYWKELSTWSELLNNAQQNVCIDNYSLDIGNGLSSDDLRGKRRKSYAKNLKTALKYANYSDSTIVIDFVNFLSEDKSGMMTFGNMVFNSIHSLHSVLGKIQDFLDNPPEELFQIYYEQQKDRFTSEINMVMQKTKDIMHESITGKRKINKLKELRDQVIGNLRNSHFLDDLKKTYTHYDVDDYRNENECKDFSDDIVLERMALSDLHLDDRQFDKKKIAKHIYEHRKILNQEAISHFYVYIEVIPEITRLLDVMKEFDNKHIAREDSKDISVVEAINAQTEVLKKIVDKPSVQIDVKSGANAQISEQGITNQFPQLPNK